MKRRRRDKKKHWLKSTATLCCFRPSQNIGLAKRRITMELVLPPSAPPMGDERDGNYNVY